MAKPETNSRQMLNLAAVGFYFIPAAAIPFNGVGVLLLKAGLRCG